MSAIIEYKEHAAASTLVFKRPSSRYFNEFIRLKCAPDLLALKLFPNAKEITESMGAYNAVRNHLKHFDFADPKITLVCVGDGSTPRTAALFAFRSAWTCYSVDPKIRDKTCWQRINRLLIRRRRIEEFNLASCGKVVIVAVHSHADLTVAWDSVYASKEKVAVAIPCCKDQRIHRKGKWDEAGDIEYEDWGIWSPKRTIKIWS